jgi:hypothetical protein
MVRPARSPSPVLFANKYCYILLTHHEDDRDKWPSKRQTFTRLARVQQKTCAASHISVPTLRKVPHGAVAETFATGALLWEKGICPRVRRRHAALRITETKQPVASGDPTVLHIHSARRCDDQAKPRTRATMPTDAINACESTRKSKGI